MPLIRLLEFSPTLEGNRFNEIVQRLVPGNQISQPTELFKLSTFTAVSENEKLLKYLQVNNVICGFKKLLHGDIYLLINSECDLDGLEKVLTCYNALNNKAREEAIKNWTPYVESVTPQPVSHYPDAGGLSLSTTYRDIDAYYSLRYTWDRLAWYKAKHEAKHEAKYEANTKNDKLESNKLEESTRSLFKNH